MQLKEEMSQCYRDNCWHRGTISTTFFSTKLYTAVKLKAKTKIESQITSWKSQR